jgi:transposase
MEELKKKFALERIITVADKAMNSKRNISDAASRNDWYIFSQKLRGKTGVPKDIQEFALSTSSWEWNEDMSVAKKSFIRKRKLEDGKEVPEKVLITFRKSYYEQEKIRREEAVSYANRLTNPQKYRYSCKQGGKKYIGWYAIDKNTKEKKELHPFLDIDKERIAYDEMFVGLNAILTSETNMSDEKIIESYGALWEIEESFRVTNSILKTRPVYVYKDEHIYSHFLVCFVALVLIKYMKFCLGGKYSESAIKTSLNSANCKRINSDCDYFDLSCDKGFTLMLSDLGIKCPDRYKTKKQIKKLVGV